jgi:endonuclease/exonuclease/phosphatase family metal-dependent hydrolase
MITNLRLATYNVHGWVGLDLIRDMGRSLAIINELGADIVGLQEVTFSDGDLGEFPRRRISNETGMEFIEGPTLNKGDGVYGNGLLTKLPIISVHRLDLSVDGREPRGALNLELELNGLKARVITTHLGLKYWERGPQIDKLLHIVNSAQDDIVIMMGDFNVWFPQSRPLKRIQKIFGPLPAPCTYPSFYPMFGLDRIWVKPSHRLGEISSYRSRMAKTASDHLPLVAELKL